MKDPWLVVGIFFLIFYSLIVLRAIAPFLFPVYLVYVLVAVLSFFVFSKIDFEIWSLFYKHFYVGSILFLALPLLIGQVTRGAVRWIQVGPLTIQPAEIVRPFLLLFFVSFLYKKDINKGRVGLALILLIVPLILILVQPSLGVAILTAIGFYGILLASQIDKKKIAIVSLLLLALVPVAWNLLAPYQKARVLILFSPGKDPFGAGYNSIQSMISVGSGKVTGRGLGEGSQTQLAFLPERHTDFIFAAVSEEMGFLGAGLLTVASFFLIYRIIKALEKAKSPQGRAFISGVFLTLFSQIFIHMGMNMGILPITGVTLPLFSAGGSSLVATMIELGMVMAARKD